MGQANQRGTFEQRKTQSIIQANIDQQQRNEREKLEQAALLQAEAERRAAMTESQREREQTKRRRARTVIAAGIGLSSMHASTDAIAIYPGRQPRSR